MKYLSLLWAGLWRKPVRTTFTFISVIVAFLLYGLLHGVASGMDALIDQMDANRLRVQSEGNRRDLLPVAYAAQIARIPNVASVSVAASFGGYFQDPKNGVGAIAVSDDFQWEKLREISLPPAQLAAFRQLRTGAVVGRAAAQLYGWKVGDRIPLTSGWTQRGGSKVWQFEIVGIYDVPMQPSLATGFWIHYGYLDEGRAFGNGTTNTFVVYTVDAQQNATVASAIDRTFENSGAPTATQSDREWQRAAWQQVLDINLLVNVMVGASMFTLLLLSGNTMMQSVAQRVPELATLKAIGYSDTKVLWLVITEALAICVAGAILGLIAARAMFPLFAHAVELDDISMPVKVPLIGLLLALVVAVATSLMPARRVSRLSVVDALSGRH